VKRYSRGAIVAHVLDDGTIDLRRQDGLSLLATIDGIPRSVISGCELEDVARILFCIMRRFNVEVCAGRGVEVA
jgi:hypothetical protein